jgi:hypothetical protein
MKLLKWIVRQFQHPPCCECNQPAKVPPYCKDHWRLNHMEW